jgi:hypothetical protein
MKRKDRETVERLVSGWMTGADKHQFMDDECRRGSSLQGKIVEYGAQLPGSSGFRETISKRADQMRNFELSAFERTAYQLIQSFPEIDRKLLVLWPVLKKRYNPDTGSVTERPTWQFFWV